MDNVIRNKSFAFAVRIVNLCKHLEHSRTAYPIVQQLLRSGTSIGANIAESEHAQSRPDFKSKLNISLKEATETDYWLRLLYKTHYLNDREFNSIFADCKEIERLLAAIVKTLKE